MAYEGKKREEIVELGQRYIDLVYQFHEQGRTDRIWEIKDESGKTVAAAATLLNDGGYVRVQLIGSTETGKGKELMRLIAEEALRLKRKIKVTLGETSPAGLWKERGFKPLGRKAMSVDPKVLLEK